jgi:YD repeat-containing protein
VQSTQQGSRVTTRSYNLQGYLASIIDPLLRERSFGVDAVGRVTTETQTDDTDILYSYDRNSNLTSVTPPGKPAHLLDYTPVDLLGSYDPPTLPTGSTPTIWT